MCSCDFDAPAFYAETVRRARKVRRCRECGTAIRVGDSYVHIAGKWDGELSTSWMCLCCREIARAITQVGCCWVQGDVRACAIDALDEYRDREFAARRARARLLRIAGPSAPTSLEQAATTTEEDAAYGRLAGLVMRQRLEAAGVVG